MDAEYFKALLRQVKFKDPASNEFVFVRQTLHWIAIKGPFDVYFTLGYDFYPKVKVMLSLEDNVIPKRAELLKNCIPANEIVIEKNSKRNKDIFSKEYEWVDKRTLELAVNSDFMGLLRAVRNELDGKRAVQAVV
jgi:hypothetical protein